MKNLRYHLEKFEKTEKFEKFAPKQKTKLQKGKKMKPIQKRLEDYE